MTAEVLETPTATAHAGTPPHPLSEFWSYFSQNAGAVAGLVVIVALVLLALLADLIVELSSDDTTEIIVPASVTIPAG